MNKSSKFNKYEPIDNHVVLDIATLEDKYLDLQKMVNQIVFSIDEYPLDHSTYLNSYFTCKHVEQMLEAVIKEIYKQKKTHEHRF